MGCPLPPPHVCEREPAAQATSRASNHPAAEWRKWSSRSLAREVVTQQIMWPCAPTTEKRGLGGGGGGQASSNKAGYVPELCRH